MPSNRKTLEEFFENEKINLRRGDLFDTPPEPMPEGFDFDRVKGMMLGLAIGDSLWKPNRPESQLLHREDSFLIYYRSLNWDDRNAGMYP